MLRIQCVTVDAEDPLQMAEFWRDVLSWRITFTSDDEVVLEPAQGSPEEGISPDLLFIKVSDSKVVKNRLHFDLRPADQSAEVDRIISLGGRKVDIGQGPDVTWIVMADIEGNEFCVLRALPTA